MNRREPRPVPVAPEMPEWLSPYAAEEWGRVVPELEVLGLVGRVDRAALVVYCEAVAAHRAAVEELAASPDMVVPSGQIVKKNPVLQVVRDQANLVAKMCAEFGMTPSSRSRMVLPDDPQTELHELL